MIVDPTAPWAGENDVIVGDTWNGSEMVAVIPAVVTVIGPVVAVAGTSAVIWSGASTVREATTPLNFDDARRGEADAADHDGAPGRAGHRRDRRQAQAHHEAVQGRVAVAGARRDGDRACRRARRHHRLHLAERRGGRRAGVGAREVDVGDVGEAGAADRHELTGRAARGRDAQDLRQDVEGVRGRERARDARAQCDRADRGSRRHGRFDRVVVHDAEPGGDAGELDRVHAAQARAGDGDGRADRPLHRVEGRHERRDLQRRRRGEGAVRRRHREPVRRRAAGQAAVLAASSSPEATPRRGSSCPA